jgi:hypothetical protein
MRWKAHFFNKNSINKNQNNHHFGLASNKTPSSIPEMKPFETDLIKLIENIQFRSGKNHFQKSLANDLKKINSSPNIFIFADKTRNIYEARSAHTTTSSYVTTLQKHINLDPRTL